MSGLCSGFALTFLCWPLELILPQLCQTLLWPLLGFVHPWNHMMYRCGDIIPAPWVSGTSCQLSECSSLLCHTFASSVGFGSFSSPQSCFQNPENVSLLFFFSATRTFRGWQLYRAGRRPWDIIPCLFCFCCLVTVSLHALPSGFSLFS